MESLAESYVAEALSVVEFLGDLDGELQRFVRDLTRLSGSVTAEPLAHVAERLRRSTAALVVVLESSPTPRDVGVWLDTIRQQSDEMIWISDAVADDLPGAQKLFTMRNKRLALMLDELASEVALRPDDYLEVRQARLRTFLAKRDAVLIVDGDPVAEHAWPEFSVLKRRDSLLAMLSLVRNRAEIDLVFDSRVGGREAATVADGVRVLLTSQSAQPSDAIKTLVSTRAVTDPVLVVTNDQELAALLTGLNRSVLPASSLLKFLVEM